MKEMDDRKEVPEDKKKEKKGEKEMTGAAKFFYKLFHPGKGNQKKEVHKKV